MLGTALVVLIPKPASFFKELGEGAGGKILPSPFSTEILHLRFSQSVCPTLIEVLELPFHHRAGKCIREQDCRCATPHLILFIPSKTREQSMQVKGHKRKKISRKHEFLYQRIVCVNTTTTEE